MKRLILEHVLLEKSMLSRMLSYKNTDTFLSVVGKMWPSCMLFRNIKEDILFTWIIEYCTLTIVVFFRSFSLVCMPLCMCCGESSLIYSDDSVVVVVLFVTWPYISFSVMCLFSFAVNKCCDVIVSPQGFFLFLFFVFSTFW